MCTCRSPSLGAYHLEHACNYPIFLSHVFTDRSIFSLNLPWFQIPAGASLTNYTLGRKLDLNWRNHITGRLKIYGPCAKRAGHKSKGKNEDRELTVRTEKTRLVRYLLYLYCVSEGLRNDSYSRGTASNFWRTSKAKRFNLKSLWKSRTFGDKSQNSFATESTLNFSGPYRRVRPAKFTNHSARTN